MSNKSLSLPLTAADVASLQAGDVVTLSGVLYTARDAAHKRLAAMLERGEALPFDPNGACIYYCGPCPAAPGEIIGPCGPTTSGRCDVYTPPLIAAGVNALIGKGARSADVKRAMIGNTVYFAATGGAGVLLAQCVKECELLAFPELGTEAIYRLRVKNFPVIVAIDASGRDLYERN